ncbi:DUF6924 domain-containing protein [Aeoliella sp.]|uniref:DUF6924 domain-containing protein n=1 Tax=Aeoliella sp. TaxID=2795800 RepID=UPI003CCC2E70
MMKMLPNSNDSLFIRTYFDDEESWQTICREIREPAAEHTEGWSLLGELYETPGQQFPDKPQAFLTIVDDQDFSGEAPKQLASCLPSNTHHSFLLVVDEQATTNPEHPILVVDVNDQVGRTFRTVPSQVQSIENNLSLANMDWEDFSESIDADGVFRGFREA